ncbi:MULTISPECIES: hypothetical protein [Photobacterium]|uniref:Uncharacterized protein n=1 Tax=Photobacterium ganghwense TaxID=320778 RepID=A0A0J1HEA0_9GAMM|nr:MULTISPECIES: hypothetical protein [Photobacterium]KLV09964.1 hypothetical protein ABT57_09855 [Photobacterium ganghwense]MBV1841786.1 hypothetical protein [Photobacterium ganghwense]PSU09186.1 hypothetical protein C9I92_06365 [Photobacterium ganghwense]QSV16379.1 hypothetical protein FH974_24580 [Photobacterium ganghwense]
MNWKLGIVICCLPLVSQAQEQALPLGPILAEQQAQREERALGDVFIDASRQSSQTFEFIGEGSRPVHNRMVDENSINQNVNTVAPTEFGAGMRFRATDDFSISVKAGGEVRNDRDLDVDSGSVNFEFGF